MSGVVLVVVFFVVVVRAAFVFSCSSLSLRPEARVYFPQAGSELAMMRTVKCEDVRRTKRSASSEDPSRQILESRSWRHVVAVIAVVVTVADRSMDNTDTT